MNTIGERIRLCRQSHNMSQNELGELIGVKGTTIGNYERGEREPDRDKIEAIADVFNTTMSWLMGEGSIKPVASDRLTKDEQFILDGMRQLTPSDRQIFLATASATLEALLNKLDKHRDG